MASDPEINRKRKINGQDFVQRKFPPPSPREENDNDFLSLSLSSFHHHSAVKLSPPPPLPQPPPPPPGTLLSLQLSSNPSPTPLPTPGSSSVIPISGPTPLNIPQSPTSGPTRQTRARRNPSQSPRQGKPATVPPPFPWATDRRATVHSLSYLLSKQISTVSGDVQCKRCERQYVLEFDLRQKFAEIGSFIAENKARMHDRAPGPWLNPALPACRFCEQENSVKPVISEKKKSINWLFLLLGQMLGCCTLDQLKYFCKHTKNHRTGAKDRVLYLTYLSLCKQLDPNGPFDR